MEELNDLERATMDERKDDDLVKKENIIILIGSIVLAVIFNILFYRKQLGVSYPIFVIVLYGVMLFTLRNKIERKISFGTILTIPVVMLSLTYLLFSNPVFGFFNFFIVPTLICIQTLLITNNNNYMWFDIRILLDFLNAVFVRTLGHIFLPFRLLSGIIKRKHGSNKVSVLGKVVIGLLISVPLVIVVIALLSEADDVFSYWVENISDYFISINFGDFVAQLIIGFCGAVIAFSYFWSLYNKADKDIVIDGEGTLKNKKVWDPVIIITVLVSINIIYVVFTTIQFTYLFGSVSSLLPEGVTYAEYARRGFFELVAVTLINLSLVTSIIGFTRNDNKFTQTILKILNSLLIFCTMIMLLSAHFRMSLYEQEYGYTYLRVFTHAFMIFIFFILIATLIKVWKEKFSLIKSYIILGLIAYISINYFNADAYIAKNNIERYETDGGKTIDIYYLGTLSDDAVPYMVKLLDNPNEEVAKGIKNNLGLRKARLSSGNDWQSFNLSRYRAKNILDECDLVIEEDNKR